MPKFRDILQMTRVHYCIDMSWDYIRGWMDHQGRYVKLDMDPPYQRGYVWTHDQKVAYLEYILKGGLSGRDIFWNCPGWMHGSKEGTLEIVDGKQRVSVVLEFLDNKVPVFGHYFEEYTDRLDTFVARFKWHVHNLEDPKDVVQWYLDMNTGGSIHTEKDLEPAYSYLRGLSLGKAFNRMCENAREALGD